MRWRGDVPRGARRRLSRSPLGAEPQRPHRALARHPHAAGVAQDPVDRYRCRRLFPRGRARRARCRQRGWRSRGDDWHASPGDRRFARPSRIARCHVTGACIGVSFALSSGGDAGRCQRDGVQDPIGFAGTEVVQAEIDQWADPVATPAWMRRCLPISAGACPAETSSTASRASSSPGATCPCRHARRRSDASGGDSRRDFAPGTARQGVKPMEGTAASGGGDAGSPLVLPRAPAGGLRR